VQAYTSPSGMLNVKFSTSTDREFCALYFHGLFPRLCALSPRRKRIRTNTWLYFRIHFEKSCFQRIDLLYKIIFIMISDMEFDLNNNGIIMN